MTKQSEVKKTVAPFGVKEILEPPVTIEDSTDIKNKESN